MNYPDLKDFVTTRPVYYLRGLVYKVGNDAWAGTPTEDDVDIWLDDGDFVLNGNSVSCEAGNDLPIGAAVSKIVQLSLVKSTKYTAADFVGAVINLRAYAERTPANETVLGGNFFVSSVTEENDAIKIVAQDELSLADKEYKMTLTGSSWTLLEIFEDVVKQIRTVPAHFDYEFLNDGFRVFAKPVGYTCRQMLGFIAMIACGNAYATSPMLGVVKIKTLSMTAPYNTLNQWLELEDSAGTISVTGLRVVQTKNINGKDVDPPVVIKSSPYSDEYAITVNNPLIVGVEGIALASMFPTLSALHFHKFKGKHIGYPLAEYGDYALVTHRGGTFNTFLTNITWNISGATEFECNIATAAENAADYDNSNGTIAKTEEEEPTTQEFDKPTNFNDAATFNSSANFNGEVSLANPLPVASGGTGVSQIRQPFTLTGSGITGLNYTAYYYPLLNLCFVRAYFKLSAELAAATPLQVLTIPENYRPGYVHAMSGYCAAGALSARVSSGNGVQIRCPASNVAATQDIYVTGFWFV